MNSRGHRLLTEFIKRNTKIDGMGLFKEANWTFVLVSASFLFKIVITVLK